MSPDDLDGDPIVAIHEMSIQHALVRYVHRHPDQFPDSFIDVFASFVRAPPSLGEAMHPSGLFAPGS